jgi:hypothetical protein
MPLTLSLLCLLLPSARAQEPASVSETLDSARAALVAKDWPKARTLLDAAEKLAPGSTTPVQARDLARVFFYRGVAAWYTGDRDKGALEQWRKARVVFYDYEPEAEVLPETDAQDVYYALGSEVQQKSQVVLNLPEDAGDAVFFVSGKRPEAQDSVYVGTHFLQVRCDDGELRGAWYTFGDPPPDWLAPCKGGSWPTAPVDPKEAARQKKEAEKRAKEEAKAAEKRAKDEARAAAAAKAEAARSEAAAKAEAARSEAVAKAEAAKDDAKADDARAPKNPKGDVPKPESKAAPKPKADAPEAVATTTDEAPETIEVPLSDLRRKRMLGAGIAAAGTAMLAGGAAMNWLVVEPARAEAEKANANPGSLSREDALALLARYDNGRFTTMGLLAAGVVTVGTGIAVLPNGTRVVATPTGLSLTGHW